MVAFADSRRLAALSETERAERPDRALLLAIEAIHRGDTVGARGNLLDAPRTRPSVTRSTIEPGHCVERGPEP
jgi:hypothetical protein